jgi:hypothetical protein
VEEITDSSSAEVAQTGDEMKGKRGLMDVSTHRGYHVL